MVPFILVTWDENHLKKILILVRYFTGKYEVKIKCNGVLFGQLFLRKRR